jgi:phospholipid transport system substrate-binding protein
MAKAQESVDLSTEMAKNTVNNIVNEVLPFLREQSEKGWNQEVVEAKFSKVLDDYFDIDYIGKASLGQFWREASDIEKDEYLKIFKTAIIKTYVLRFKEYKNENIEVIKEDIQGKKDIIVYSNLINEYKSSPAVDINWRVRKEKNGIYKVIDLDVAGISMLITQRNEYQSIINQNGGKVSAIIAKLKEVVANN